MTIPIFVFAVPGWLWFSMVMAAVGTWCASVGLRWWAWMYWLSAAIFCPLIWWLTGLLIS